MEKENELSFFLYFSNLTRKRVLLLLKKIGVRVDRITVWKINHCINNIRAGRLEPAVTDLHKHMGNHLHFIAYKYFRDQAKAMDLVQDFWLNIEKYCRKCRYLQNGFNYLTKIFENNCKMQVRKDNATCAKLLPEDVGAFAEVLSADEESLFRQTALKATFDKALKTMTEEEAAVFKLVCYGNKTVREMSEELSISRSTVGRVRKSMMEKLKAALIEDGWDKDVR